MNESKTDEKNEALSFLATQLDKQLKIRCESFFLLYLVLPLFFQLSALLFTVVIKDFRLITENRLKRLNRSHQLIVLNVR